MKTFFINIWYTIWPITPIELLLTVFALFAWSRVILRFRAKLVNQKELAFWTILWLSAIVIVYIPKKTTVLANLLGMGRGFDAMMFLAVIGIVYSVYRLYMKINEFEQETTEIIRKIALNLDVKKGKKGYKDKI